VRRYLRHPIDLPIELYPAFGQPRLRLRNYSFGGLCCISPRRLPPGTAVEIEIPDIQPTEVEAFESRMAEQLCHIESYRRRVSLLEGRELSPDEAASEWIIEYAQRYPRHSLF
jgi:hypothetical protein